MNWNKIKLAYQRFKNWYAKESEENSGSQNCIIAMVFGLFAMILSCLTPIICFWLITHYTGTWFVDLLGNFVGLIHTLLALAMFFTIVLHTYKWFIIIVPEFVAQGVLNLRTGLMNVYFQGFHFKLPWEQVKKENLVSLQKITVPIAREFVAKDGSVAVIEGFVQYRCQKTKEGVVKYIGTEESEIVTNIVGKVENHLIKDIVQDTYETVRSKIMEIGKDLATLYHVVGADEKKHELKEKIDIIENECGIIVDRVVINSVKFSKGTQDAITSRFEMETLKDAPEPTDNQLIMLGKTVTKNVFGFDFGKDPEVSKSALGVIEKVMTGPAGAAIAVAVASKAGSGGKPSNPKGGKS